MHHRVDAVTMRPRRAGREERGTVIVMVAMMMTAMIIVTALVLDVGNASQDRRQAQSAADAAALAGAQLISSGAVTADLTLVQDIQAKVAQNFGTVAITGWNGCSDPGALTIKPDALPLVGPALGGNNDTCISLDADLYASPPTALVRVKIPPKSIPTGFAGISGLNHLNVTASATANVSYSFTIPPCAFCSLGNNANLQNGSITLHDIVAGGGSLYFGGAVSCNPHSQITAENGGQNHVVGTNTCPTSQFSPAPTAVASLGDPLGPASGFPANPKSFLTGASYSALPDQGSCTGTTVLPGRYANINGCVLSPGLYVVTGALSGATETAPGVTIFFTCGTDASPQDCSSPGQAGGYIGLSGSTATLNLASCTAGTCLNNAIPGMVLWFDRNNTGYNGSGMSVGGGSHLGLVGTIYMADAQVAMNGSPSAVVGACNVNQVFCSEFVVNGVTFAGQITLTTYYDPAQNYVTPPKPVHLTT